MYKRRTFLQKTAAATLASSAYPNFLSSQEKREEREPHFFLQVFYPGGLDFTYTFDARPLEFIGQNKHANYLKVEPKIYKGNNDFQTLITASVDPFKKWLDRFTVFNGVVMVPQFDGHENNVSHLFTGGSFGGDALFPMLNKHHLSTPLDYVQVGDGLLLTEITNGGNGIPITPNSLRDLSKKIQAIGDLTQNPSWGFANRRLVVRGKGHFSRGVKALQAGLESTPKLFASLSDVEIGESESDLMKNMRVIGHMFKKNLVTSGVYVFDTDLSEDRNLDTHDSTSAQKMPDVARSLMSDLDQIISYLHNTPYDDNRSLLDVTTVCVASEFGRTMRQYGDSVENQGTDHNPLSNTILLGGKGIKGGQVIGQSDFQSLDEQLSRVHYHWDDAGRQWMGRPFDFATNRPRVDSEDSYYSKDYLNFLNIGNTVMKLFGMPQDRFWSAGRNEPAAELLNGILI